MFIECPAMSYHAAVGRVIAHASSDQQRTVEPTSILVRAFEVDIGGPFVALQNREMRGAGIEPYIENVIFFAPSGRAARTFRVRRQKFFGGMLVPSVGAFAFEP